MYFNLYYRNTVELDVERPYKFCTSTNVIRFRLTVFFFSELIVLFAGDHAVKAVGVIPEPEVKTFDLQESDQFMIMASDGVWEFITSQVNTQLWFLFTCTLLTGQSYCSCKTYCFLTYFVLFCASFMPCRRRWISCSVTCTGVTTRPAKSSLRRPPRAGRKKRVTTVMM